MLVQFSGFAKLLCVLGSLASSTCWCTWSSACPRAALSAIGFANVGKGSRSRWRHAFWLWPWYRVVGHDPQDGRGRGDRDVGQGAHGVGPMQYDTPDAAPRAAAVMEKLMPATSGMFTN